MKTAWQEHKLKSVRVVSGYTISVVFTEGTVKEFDVSSLFGIHPMFDALKENYDLFMQVRLSGKSGIMWNDDIDLGAEKIWFDGKTISTIFDDLIGMSEATKMWGLNESTIRQAIRRGRFIKGEDVRKFGSQWVLSKGAIQREYGMCIKDKIEWYEDQLDELEGEVKEKTIAEIDKLKTLLKNPKR